MAVLVEGVAAARDRARDRLTPRQIAAAASVVREEHPTVVAGQPRLDEVPPAVF